MCCLDHKLYLFVHKTLTAHSTDMYIPKQYLLFVVHHHSPGRLFCTKANGEHMTSLYNREKGSQLDGNQYVFTFVCPLLHFDTRFL